MTAAFAALALVSWYHNQVEQPWPPSTVSLCSEGPLPESRCLSTRVTPLILPQTVQWPQCQHCASHCDLVRLPARHLAIRFTSFAGGSENFTAACLTAAHCILIRAISCSSVSSVPQRRFACSVVRARCSAASARQPGYCIASCPPSVLCSAVKSACHLRARQPEKTTNRARTYARALSTRLFLPMPLACPPAQCSTCASSPGVSPSSSA